MLQPSSQPHTLPSQSLPTFSPALTHSKSASKASTNGGKGRQQQPLSATKLYPPKIATGNVTTLKQQTTLTKKMLQADQ